MAYSRKIAFTINHTQVGGSDLTDFTIVVVGTFAELKTVANGGQIQNQVGGAGAGAPCDFVVSPNQDGSSRYDFEIADYQPTTGFVEVHFRRPTVSASADGTFYFVYNDASVTTFQGTPFGANSEWDANYQGVYHLAQGVAPDSTNSHAQGAVTGATQVSPAVVGDGLSFAGGTDVVEVSHAAAGGNDFPNYARPMTFEFWARLPAAVANGMTIAAASVVEGNFAIYARGDFESKGFATIDIYTSGSDGELGIPYPTDNADHHYVLAVDAAGNLTATMDGVAQTVTTITAGVLNPHTSTVLKFGQAFGALVGRLDEVRFSKVARIAAGAVGYALACYNNQKTGSTFLTAASPADSNYNTGLFQRRAAFGLVGMM
jgi:hypothetical protein